MPAEFAVLVGAVFAEDVIVVLKDAGGEGEGDALFGLIFPIFARIPLEPYRYTNSITRMASGCSRISLAFSFHARRLSKCSTFVGVLANGAAGA